MSENINFSQERVIENQYLLCDMKPRQLTESLESNFDNRSDMVISLVIRYEEMSLLPLRSLA